jgi:TolB-like protein/DNA-binding winged helix-turn-helix (wHTH) protein/Tfp pilus assembly protein PilF
MAVEIQKKYLLGEYELDAGSHSLVRSGTPIPLSRKRFQVLLCLVAERQRLVSRQELLERFWDGHEVYEENLTKCISEIRKALDDQKKPHQFIETVPAVGYRYIGPLTEEALQLQASSFEVESTRAVKLVVEEDDGQNAVVVSEKALPGKSPAFLTGNSRPVGFRQSSWLMPAVLAVVIVALAAGAFIIYRSRTRPAAIPAAPIRSVAVLSLRDMSPDTSNEFFSDGMTETLINTLSQVEELKVVSRGAVFRYKGQEVAPQEVGRQLDVAAVLEGSVRRDADSVRVAVRLVSTDDGRVLWANESYERKLKDIFALQDEIARDVVAELRLKLVGDSARRLARHYTENVEAYQLFLKGRFYWNQLTKTALEQSIGYYKLAIAKDPNYALAYVGMADSYVVLGFDFMPPREALAQAKVAAAKALELDKSLGAAHISMGAVKLFLEWDWAGAGQEAQRAKELNASYRKAIELNTSYGDTHHYYCSYLDAIGRADESVREIKQALQIDPLSQMLGMELGWSYYNARQYDEAIAECRKALAQDDKFSFAYLPLAMALEQKGKYEEAIVELKRAQSLPGGSAPPFLAELGYAYARTGQQAAALKLLNKLKGRAREEFIDPYNIAIIYVGLGDKDQGFTWLDKARQEHSPNIVWLNIEPKFDGLRSDRRFAVLVRRIGLTS